MLAAPAAARETDVRIGALELSSGATLPEVVQRVTLHGANPLADGSNVAFAPHALTGSSRVVEWWSGLVGPDALFDPARWCVVGINALGSCYGSTGPLSPGPDGRRWGPRFPLVTVADMVEAQRRAQGIAQNANARDAIALDPAFRRGWYAAPPRAGLGLARAIATLTYKSEALFERRFANRPDRRGAERFDVEGYLAYQGERFAERIDANAYIALTRAMDRFDLRGRERPAGATRLTFVGIEGDQLFGPAHVRACALRWREAGWNAVYREQRSDHGHDAFLAEAETLGALLQAAE